MAKVSEIQMAWGNRKGKWQIKLYIDPLEKTKFD
tara:strand:+ start:622 stop:723 length:102 start_codon:yes stop_codon:yes gene_type:complete